MVFIILDTQNYFPQLFSSKTTGWTSSMKTTFDNLPPVDGPSLSMYLSLKSLQLKQGSIQPKNNGQAIF